MYLWLRLCSDGRLFLTLPFSVHRNFAASHTYVPPLAYFCYGLLLSRLWWSTMSSWVWFLLPSMYAANQPLPSMRYGWLWTHTRTKADWYQIYHPLHDECVTFLLAHSAIRQVVEHEVKQKRIGIFPIVFGSVSSIYGCYYRFRHPFSFFHHVSLACVVWRWNVVVPFSTAKAHTKYHKWYGSRNLSNDWMYCTYTRRIWIALWGTFPCSSFFTLRNAQQSLVNTLTHTLCVLLIVTKSVDSLCSRNVEKREQYKPSGKYAFVSFAFCSHRADYQRDKEIAAYRSFWW